MGVSLPSNWKLCDGTTYNGITTPDLRDKFVMSSGNSNTIGSEITYNSLSSSEYTTTYNPTKNFITLNNSNLYLIGSKFGEFYSNDNYLHDGFGSQITLTRDGTTAVVARGTRRGGILGHRIYKFNGYIWSFEGNITHTQYPDAGVKNVCISDDGTTIAILINYGTGIIQIYNKNFKSDGQWGDLIQTYSNPYSSPATSIYYVDLVKNGADITVAFTCCTNYDDIGGGLLIKRYNGSSWLDIGTFNSTTQERFNSECGAVKLSSDGNIVCHLTFSGISYNTKIYTRIYIGGTTWNIDLNQNIFSYYPPSICMSLDGYTVGICRLNASGLLNNSAITIYKKNISINTWSTFGEINGDQIGDWQAAGNLTGLSMSGDGLIIAASSDRSIDNTGRLTVYKYSGVGTTWNKIAQLVGEKRFDYLGASNSISSDGKIIAVGSIGPYYQGYAAIYRIGPTRTLDVNINKYYSLAYIMRIS